ncbi:MAG: hypothetical protein IPH57_12915 [Saprospiraceae bacterium]|nr:hypothetical protein [Saprospiraceae bacterium]
MDQQSGLLNFFNLELCAEFYPKFPYIVNNNILKIPLKAYWPIPATDLKVADENNSDEDPYIHCYKKSLNTANCIMKI